MNNDTGHLIDMSDMTIEERMKKLEEGYEELDEKMELLVKLELAGRKEAHVGKHASGTLSTLAREHRNMKQFTKRKV